MAVHQPIRLADYTPWSFALPQIDLDFDIQADHVLVSSRLQLEPRWPGAPLILCGVDLDIQSIAIDDRPLSPDAWRQSDGTLVIDALPDVPFVLSTCCCINPFDNTSLEGLYASGGMLTSQCEAEGFRRITFHPDRPDVLSRWRVRIAADRHRCPVLLSK